MVSQNSPQASDSPQLPNPIPPSSLETPLPPPQIIAKNIASKYRKPLIFICIILFVSLGLNVFIFYSRSSPQETLTLRNQICLLEGQITFLENQIKLLDDELLKEKSNPGIKAEYLDLLEFKKENETKLKAKDAEISELHTHCARLSKTNIESANECTALSREKTKLQKNLANLPRALFDQQYLEFYKNPDSVKMEKLNQLFSALQALFPADLYPVKSAEMLFCEHMEHLYLDGILFNDFIFTMVVQNMFKFCPNSTIRIDFEKGLENHIKTYVSREFIFSQNIDTLEDSDIFAYKSEKIPIFLQKCISLYNNLTGKKFSTRHFGILNPTSFDNVYTFPELPKPPAIEFEESLSIFHKLSSPADFLGYSTHNHFRLSLISRTFSRSDRTSFYPYSLLSLFSDNSKFLFWYFRKDQNAPDPTIEFLDDCNIFFNHIITFRSSKSLKVDFDYVRGSVPQALLPNDRDEINIVKDLLPPLDQPFESLNLGAYQKMIWHKLIAQHNDALLEFLPTEIRDVPLENASKLLPKVLNAISSSRDKTLLKEDPLYKIFSPNSESNNFLILKYLYSKAKLNSPTMFTEDPDIYARKYIVIPTSSSE
jgi:hypothetical protein